MVRLRSKNGEGSFSKCVTVIFKNRRLGGASCEVDRFHWCLDPNSVAGNPSSRSSDSELIKKPAPHIYLFHCSML